MDKHSRNKNYFPMIENKNSNELELILMRRVITREHQITICAGNNYHIKFNDEGKLLTAQLQVFPSLKELYQSSHLVKNKNTTCNKLELISTWNILTSENQIITHPLGKGNAFVLKCSKDWNIYDCFDKIRNYQWYSCPIDYFKEKALEKILGNIDQKENPENNAKIKSLAEIKKKYNLNSQQLELLLTHQRTLEKLATDSTLQEVLGKKLLEKRSEHSCNATLFRQAESLPMMRQHFNGHISDESSTSEEEDFSFCLGH